VNLVYIIGYIERTNLCRRFISFY